MSRKIIAIIILIAVGIGAYVMKKDNAPLIAEIDKIKQERTMLADELRRFKGQTIPIATDFDDIRFKLRSLAVQPVYAASAFTFAVTANTPSDLIAKIFYVKQMLPCSYIDKLQLSNTAIKAIIVTKEGNQ
jgi:hypothetical protein